jgi:hypothetical protein
MRTCFISGIILFLVFSFFPAFGQETGQKEAAVVGQLFGAPVPAGNYYFVKSALAVFGNKWGAQPKTQEEVEDVVWEQLVLSFEAFRKGITVSTEERDKEIAGILQAQNAGFDWQKDKAAYAKLVKEKTGEEAELFENQISHLLQLQKLREQVMAELTPSASEAESHQAFLNEQNSIELELAQFEEQAAAEEFYNKVKKNPKLWDEEKAKTPDKFKRPGFVTLIFLMDFWKITPDDLYKMMKLKADTIYPPAPIYKGYGVFKVLNKKPADEANYEKMKYSYRDKVIAMKKYEGMVEWIKKLKEDANIQIYRKGGE